MDLFKRSILKIKSTSNIKHINRPFTTKDLFLNKVVLIDFILGQEIYYYVQKHEHKEYTGFFYNSKTIQEIIKDIDKVLSIELCSLKSSQFKSEQRAITNYIKQVGVTNNVF